MPLKFMFAPCETPIVAIAVKALYANQLSVVEVVPCDIQLTFPVQEPARLRRLGGEGWGLGLLG